jgi:hypothetical protein
MEFPKYGDIIREATISIAMIDAPETNAITSREYFTLLLAGLSISQTMIAY